MWMLSRITVIADTSGAQQRGRQITSMFGVTQIGMLSGPLVGGLTADHFGLWVPFLMHGVIVMVAVIPSFFIIKETMAARSPSGQPGGGRRQGLSMPDLRKPPIPYVFLIQFLANVTRGGIFGGGVIIVYAAFAYDMSPTDIGGLRSAMAVVGIPMTFTAGYIMDRFGRKFTIVPGLTLSGLSMAFLALTDVFDLSRAVFIVAFVAVHLSVSLISGNMQTLGTDVAPAHARGSFFGVSRLIAQVGSLASPVSFTVLVTFATYGAAFALLASSALAGGLVMLTLVPETLRKVGSPPKAQDASQQSSSAARRPGVAVEPRVALSVDSTRALLAWPRLRGSPHLNPPPVGEEARRYRRHSVALELCGASPDPGSGAGMAEIDRRLAVVGLQLARNGRARTRLGRHLQA